MNKKDKCSTPHCRGNIDVIYLGEGLCKECWEKKCGDD